MTYSELKNYINRWVETIKTTTRIDGYRLNIVLQEILDYAQSAAAGSEVLVGNTLYVSDQGKTVAGGALRENLTNHFSSVAEAWAAAQPNDTIVVFPGSYTVNTTFSGKDVDWYFYPGASFSGSFSWSDLGSTRNVVIGGYGEFSGTGNKFNISDASSNYSVECEFISTTNVAIQHTNGTGKYKVKGNITSSSGATIYMDGGSNVIIEADSITNTRVGNAVTTFNVRPSFTGSLTVTADYMDNNPGATAANMFVWERVGSTGTVIVNIGSEATTLGSAPNSVFKVRGGGGLTINGFINGRAGHAISVDSEGGNVTHNGDATNDGTLTLINLINTTGQTIKLNGEYTSSNQYTITVNGAGVNLYLNGRVVNTEGTAIQKAGIYINVQANTVVEDATIVVNATGTPNAAYAPSATTDIKVYKMIATHTYNGNIANSITGALEVVDTDVI